MDTLVEEFSREIVEGFGDQTKGQLCPYGVMKEMRSMQIEWVIIVVPCCMETLSMDAWSYGCGKDLAPDLYRQRPVHLGKPELVRWPWLWLPERRAGTRERTGMS